MMPPGSNCFRQNELGLQVWGGLRVPDGGAGREAGEDKSGTINGGHEGRCK